MITNIYNEKVESLIADNGEVQQGVLSKRLIYLANQVANNNHTPAPHSNRAHSEPTSFSKSLDHDDNPITQEGLSDGLGALFGAATGLEGLEMIIDYGCDMMEFYDDFMRDRFGNTITPPPPQPDPRLWSVPQPGMGMVA